MPHPSKISPHSSSNSMVALKVSKVLFLYDLIINKECHSKVYIVSLLFYYKKYCIL